ncbi:putative phosphatase regulatory subunit [Clostridium puniceum]|uniref:Putative phosphatase regulatory subunit n=1 Tax=Clostridium puniceum TaxID=29367 RepID=A0A1S8T7E6_9CLOT|nr:hypothetical protein [Clostridium puniceum]OOM73385.1 putative phosphatase regulatory subunit [Clostridium puniceum]
MNLSRYTKKCYLFTLMIFIFSTLLIMDNSIKVVKAAEKPVELYYTYNNPYYIGDYRTIYIKTNVNGDNESVAIHGIDSENSEEWKDYSGSYVNTLGDGSKIWKVDLSYVGSSIEYAIKYQVNGETYWDNNNGNNYTNKNILGAAVIGVNPIGPEYKNPSNYEIRVNIKNLNYVKNMKVRYTENNWDNNSFKDVPLIYVSTNEDGSELWGTTLTLNENTIGKFHYAVSYKVNGIIYWDNNFGANYDY